MDWGGREMNDTIAVEPDSIGVRPLEASDRAGLLDLGSHLSLRSRYLRFFSPIHVLAEPLLTHLVVVDHRDREALAAVFGEQVVGVARYDRSAEEPDAAEIAVVVADDWQRHGLARRLLIELGRLAVERGIRVFTATTLVDNRPVAGLLHQLWPSQHGRYSDGLYRYQLPLDEMAGSQQRQLRQLLGEGTHWEELPSEGVRGHVRGRVVPAQHRDAHGEPAADLDDRPVRGGVGVSPADER
jgi:GNAT superfamily N-acetyltransferase